MTVAAAIKLDVTPVSVVAVCTLCGWRALRLDRAAAWAASAAHERDRHPADSDAARRRARA